MGSRNLAILSMLGLVGLLAAVAYFEPGIEPPAPPAPLTTLQAAEITTLRIERVGGQTLRFERHEGKWRMTEPVTAPVGEQRIKGVLEIAGSSGTARYPASEVELAAVGLDEPELRLVFNDRETLAFGDSEPLDQRRYVRVGETVHLIPESGYYRVIGDYTTFIDTALLPAGAAVSALRLPDLALTREQGRWRASPAAGEFSPDQANALIDHWRHARAFEVRRYQGGGRDEVTLTLEGGEGLRYVVVAREPELILARPDLGLQYHLPADGAARLFQLPAGVGEP